MNSVNVFRLRCEQVAGVTSPAGVHSAQVCWSQLPHLLAAVIRLLALHRKLAGVTRV